VDERLTDIIPPARKDSDPMTRLDWVFVRSLTVVLMMFGFGVLALGVGVLLFGKYVIA
jgi:hypothetical protein